jgi:hypothetical protein
MLTPTPDWRDPDFQHGSRWQQLWAATLCSLDDFFPIPFRGGAAPQAADYSRADVLYATRRGEGPPRSDRACEEWEARPGMAGPATAGGLASADMARAAAEALRPAEDRIASEDRLTRAPWDAFPVVW